MSELSDETIVYIPTINAKKTTYKGPPDATIN
jgi:hypothetical protein